MAIPHAYPGMPVDLRPAQESLSEARTTALVKNDTFEAIAGAPQGARGLPQPPG